MSGGLRQAGQKHLKIGKYLSMFQENADLFISWRILVGKEMPSKRQMFHNESSSIGLSFHPTK